MPPPDKCLQQARAFKEAVKRNRCHLNKNSNSSARGVAFAIQRELGLPNLFAGLGENGRLGTV